MILAPCLYIVYTTEMNKQVSCFQKLSCRAKKHICIKAKRKERKKTGKSSLVMFLFVWLRARLASRALSASRPSIIPKTNSILAGW